ncbi:LysM peptidoglycan-binding domain-containing protein, partial [Paenibacillus harenae]|uniref:LysM peptidoglycan-binding domain-containing protein n=1 Tax=Paenibacillus harenae TaxID=306543 RepID=UPI001B7F9458
MKIHIVKKGDTLYSISQKYNVSLEEILRLNPGITNPDAIDVGMKLKIPSSHTGGHGGGMDIMHQHVVKQGDTLWKLSKAWGVPLADMIKANPQLKNPNVLLTGEIVNIPKAGSAMPDMPSAPNAQSAGGAHPLHPSSIMQGVQGLVGKLSTAPILGKTPTGPIAGKAPTAPVTPVPLAAPAPAPAPAPVVQEKKPTAPIVKPVQPAAIPAPKPVNIQPPKKALPIEKPVEKKLKPIHSEYKPNVDLFKQYGVPATEVMSLHDMPNMHGNVSPASMQQPTYGGYGYGQPMTLPAQTGYGYGGGQQPMPYPNMVSPFGEGGNDAPYDCPPGTVFMGGYPSPSALGADAGPGWGHGYGYGNSMVSPMQHGMDENNGFVAGASSLPNQGISPMSTMPNQG